MFELCAECRRAKSPEGAGRVQRGSPVDRDELLAHAHGKFAEKPKFQRLAFQLTRVPSCGP